MTDENKLPPHDFSAEAALVSAALIDSQRIDDALEYVPSSEAFYSEAHRRVFEACVALHQARTPVDTVTVATWLRERGRLEQVGGMAYVVELLNAAPSVSPDAVRAYARTVREKYQLRQLLVLAQETVARCYLGGPDADGLVDRVATRVAGLAELRATDTLEHISAIVTRAYADVQAKAERVRQGRPAGIPSSLVALNRILGGSHGGDVTLVAARPGMGKSALAFQELVAAAQLADMGGVGFSLEMPREQIAKRLAAAQGGVSVRRVRAARLGRVAWRRLADGCAMLHDLPIWLEDKAGITVPDMRARVRRVQRELAPSKRKVGLVVVDYVQLARSVGGSRDSREQQVAEISRSLKELAKDLHVAVIALSQLSRAVELRQDKRPQLSDLRESGSLEQDADNIVFIYRDEYYDGDTKLPGVAELIVGKQRNGPTGTVYARWVQNTTSFVDLTEVERAELKLPPLADEDADDVGVDPDDEEAAQ